MRLAPRQLKRKGVPGYYGGRLTPGVVNEIQRQAQARGAEAARQAPPVPPPRPSDPMAALAALDELLDHGVITESEHADLRNRIEAGD